MDICDTLIHVRSALTAEERGAIETALREADGVIAPRFTLPQVLAVLYNPARITGLGLLNVVRGRGLPASLVAI